MKNSKLTAKAAKLDFSQLPGTVSAPQGSEEANGGNRTALPVRPKTAPGAMMAFANDSRSELLKENEALRAKSQESDRLRSRLDEVVGELQQWDGAKATKWLNPQEISPSRFANRHASSFAGGDYLKLKSEIQEAGGNVQPIKVRPIKNASSTGPFYELVFGHRRHRACLELGIQVLAVVDNLDDQTLFVEMERENRSRKDLSAWEQGMMYRRALDQGLFPSNRKLADAIGVDLSALGKALALAQLPDDVVNAFPSPLALQFRWAKPLTDAVQKYPKAVKQEIQRIRSEQTVSAREVFERLSAAGLNSDTQGVEPFHPDRGVLTIESFGQEVATLTTQKDGSLLINVAAVAMQPGKLNELKVVLETFFRNREMSSSTNNL